MLPFVFLILLFVIPNKVAMLTTWILSIIIIDAFLIVVEYMRDRYARQLGVSAMSADAFRDAVLRGYTHRHLTFRTYREVAARACGRLRGGSGRR